ncbi:MAG: hypothetical protein K9K88_12075 [Desulfobacterales bacterium]|nr:hypothetical protein [Desulfobacterales bacterium]
MDVLFTPFSLRSLTLSNRIAMPPLASFLTDKGGTVNENTVEHYRKRAAGGPAR